MMSVVDATSARSGHDDVPVLAVDDVEDDTSSSCSHSEEGESATLPGVPHSDSEQNQGKDSGVDCGSDVIFDPPDEDTINRIIETVEHYLSDANILKDPFLLKHVRRNKEGYVSVKLISSFRKVRSLCRCWKAVAFSLQRSQKLALNSEATKVRRLDPLPDYDETVPSRSVIVYGFPMEKPSVETVSEMFSKCGEIALVRVLRPGSAVPPDVKRFMLKNPDIQSKVCALVEFEDHTGARQALTLHCERGKLSGGLRVVPLALKEREKIKPESSKMAPKLSPPKESPKKKKRNKRSPNYKQKSEDKDSPSEMEFLSAGQRTRRRSSDSLGYWSSGSISSSGYLSSSPSSMSDSRYHRRHSLNQNLVSYLNSPTSAFASLNRSSVNKSGSRDRLSFDRDGESISPQSGSLSPWRRRKEMLLRSELAGSFSTSSSIIKSSSPNFRLPVQVVRHPRGPDGTGGFHRPRLTVTVE